MQPVKYDVPDAQSSLEYILEQVTHGTDVVIVRNGVEVARISPVKEREPRRMVAKVAGL